MWDSVGRQRHSRLGNGAQAGTKARIPLLTYILRAIAPCEGEQQAAWRPRTVARRIHRSLRERVLSVPTVAAKSGWRLQNPEIQNKIQVFGNMFEYCTILIPGKILLTSSLYLLQPRALAPLDRFDFPLFSQMRDSANGAGLMLLRESQNTSNRLRNAQIEDPEYATRESLSGYFHVACWLLLMAFCYTLSRFGCGWGIPSDCHPQDSLELANDMQMILLYGVLLMWFIGLLGHADSRSRFRWLFLSGRRTAAFCSLAAVSGPSFAALGELRGLQASISPGSPMFNPRERAFWALMTGFVLVTFALVWHVRHAWHLFHRNATRRTADRRQDSSPARSWHGERLSTQQSAVSHTDAGELRFALDDGGGSLSDENSRCSSSELAFSVAGLQPRRRSRRCCGQAGRSFWAYCVGRIGVLGFYVTYSLLASQRAHLHFHHYWIGLMAAVGTL